MINHVDYDIRSVMLVLVKFISKHFHLRDEIERIIHSLILFFV